MKQAYRRLSIQYHPDTSGKKNAEKFIEITRAYQRIINSSDTVKTPPLSSSTTWSYREDKSSPQKRTKKYLYLLSFICVALLLIIATLSTHYQKRAMLKSFSKNKKVSSIASSPAKQPATLAEQQPSLQQQAPLLPSMDTVNTETKVNIEHDKKLEEQESVFQGKNKAVTTNTKAPALPNIVQKNTAEPSVVPEKTSLAQSVMPKIRPDHNIEKGTPFSSLPPPFSAQSGNINAKEEEAASSQQQPDDRSFTALLNQKDIQDIPKTHKEVIPSEARQIREQRENSSPFSEIQDQKLSIIRPMEKKVRPLKPPEKKNTQASQDILIRNSLRAFTTNYAATFMSRNIKKFDLLFADGALENGVSFLSLRHKYEQLFSTTQAIEYRIDLLGTEIHKKGATATLTGRFHVRLIYSSNKIEANSGTITFFLVKNKGSYKINALTYQLDPKRL